MSGKERAALRGEAHRLEPLVHLGQQGITQAAIASLDDALRTHELVKVRLGRNTDIPARDAARQLAEATGSDVIQVIGKTTTLYRENPDLPHRSGGQPAWRG